MKRLTRFRKFLLPMNRKSLLAGGWITFCILFFTACQEDRPWLENPFSASEGKEMQLTIKMPSSFSSALTRGLTGEEESAIVNKDIMVLIFNKSNMYVRKESATSVNPQDATTTNFSVKLTLSTDATDTYNIVTLANAKDIIDRTNLDGKSYAEVTALLKKEITGAMFTTIGTGIPMWGETGAIKVAGGTSIPTVSLHRSVARIDVGVGAVSGDNSNFVWLNPTNIPFELTEVIVARPNKEYAVIPQVGTFSTTEPIKAVLPSVPAGAGKFSIADSEKSFKYTDITNKRYTTRSIYIPESDIIMGDAGGTDPVKHTERLAILVGGKYKGGSVTYYRIDFKTTNALNPNQKDFIHVLRNHLYQFNITSVTGDGYKTPEEAYKATLSNMSTKVQNWNDGELSDVAFDGQYYFAVSQPAVTFTPFGDESQTMTIKTNVEDFELWEAGTLRLKVGATQNYGPTVNGYNYALVKKEGDIYELTIGATKPNVGEPSMSRIENWEIVARRLKKSIEVSQQWTRYYVSVGNGESTVLLPEGTVGNPIEINVLSKKPVTVVSSGAWVNLGNTSGLNTPNSNGLYGASLNLGVATYRLGADGTDHRVATVTLKSAGESDIIYTVLQEAPYLTIEPAVLYVLRPAVPALMKNVIEVRTNIQRADLTLSRGTGSGTGNNLIALDGSLYNVDAIRRDQRFQVNTNLTGTPPESNFNVPFKVEPPSGKYGNLANALVTVMVASKTPLFNLFWKQGRNFTTGNWEWTADASDETNNYIFPWNASEVKLELESNRSFREGSHSLGGGALTVGDGIGGEGAALKYPVTYTFPAKRPTDLESYSMEFKSDPDILPSFFGVINLPFKRGFQKWTDSSVGGNIEIPYFGKTESDSDGIKIINNVEWSYLASRQTTDWIKLRTGGLGSFTSPNGTAVRVDSRPAKPVAVPTTDLDPNSKLCQETSLQWTIEAQRRIQPDVVVRKRSVEISFKNLSATGVAGDVKPSREAITITQYEPRLYWVSTFSEGNGMPILGLGGATAEIPIEGGNFHVKVSVNLTSWFLRAYPVGTIDNVLTARNTVKENGLEGSTEREVILQIPPNYDSREKRYSIVLEAPGMDPERRVISEAVHEPTLISNPGVHGVSMASHRIVVLGSADNQRLMLTTRAETEGAYFQFGGTIAYSGVSGSAPLFSPNNATAYLPDTWSHSGSVVHTVESLRTGRGDPCRLLGFRQRQVRDSLAVGKALDNGRWKLPSNDDSSYSGLPSNHTTWEILNGIIGQRLPTSSILNDEKFIPAHGRLIDMSLGGSTDGGYHWTSKESGSIRGFAYVNGEKRSGIDQVYKSYGLNVRCVRQ